MNPMRHLIQLIVFGITGYASWWRSKMQDARSYIVVVSAHLTLRLVKDPCSTPLH